ncbi:MAG: DUF222 domain-containing protein, partial [Bifidobacteriaceae bacterium]|nr:DUF222 domain-containing protein [Bifidobacteriaceae bacterium]
MVMALPNPDDEQAPGGHAEPSETGPGDVQPVEGGFEQAEPVEAGPVEVGTGDTDTRGHVTPGNEGGPVEGGFEQAEPVAAGPVEVGTGDTDTRGHVTPGNTDRGGVASAEVACRGRLARWEAECALSAELEQMPAGPVLAARVMELVDQGNCSASMVVELIAGLGRSIAALEGVRAYLVWGAVEPHGGDTLEIRSTIEEIAVRIGHTYGTVRRMVELGMGMAAAPDLGRAVCDGQIGAAKATQILRDTEHLDPDRCSHVISDVMSRNPETRNLPDLRRLTRTLAEWIDPLSAADEHARARSKRSVWIEKARHGMAFLHAYLPAIDAHQVYATLTTMALGEDPDLPTTLTTPATPTMSPSGAGGQDTMAGGGVFGPHHGVDNGGITLVEDGVVSSGVVSDGVGTPDIGTGPPWAIAPASNRDTLPVDRPPRTPDGDPPGLRQDPPGPPGQDSPGLCRGPAGLGQDSPGLGRGPARVCHARTDRDGWPRDADEPVWDGEVRPENDRDDDGVDVPWVEDAHEGDTTEAHAVKVTCTLGNRRADALMDLFSPTGPLMTGRPFDAVRPRLVVVARAEALLGSDHFPGELIGYGTLPAHAVRRIAQDATWSAIYCDPHTGRVVGAGTRILPPGLTASADPPTTANPVDPADSDPPGEYPRDTSPPVTSPPVMSPSADDVKTRRRPVVDTDGDSAPTCHDPEACPDPESRPGPEPRPDPAPCPDPESRQDRAPRPDPEAPPSPGPCPDPGVHLGVAGVAPPGPAWVFPPEAWPAETMACHSYRPSPHL